MRPFAVHVAARFERRSREMDTPYLRLALFLDPRFKLAVKTAENYSGELQRLAVSIAKRRGYSFTQCINLRTQLLQYQAGVDSVWTTALQGLTASTSPVTFWSALRCRDGFKELATLALVLHSIPPHAAGPERLFSAMGWFEGGRRACLAVDTNAKLATIKMHVDQQQRKHGTERERHAPEGDLELDLDDATAEEVEELARIAEQSGWQHASLPQVTRMSYAELLFGAWDGFDMRAACLTAPAEPVVATENAEFVAGGDGDGFSVDDVLNADFVTST